MQAPGKIKKLDEVVVNRIAAGEIIQRPANALKELIENSLDAKSTNIQITVKDGGLKMLQIQDNGTGIRKDDMEIVCERFTTSKLQNFDDLKSIATFGFRGEALASISHVALLTITTKTASEKCGYKASYIDSKLKAPPKPCAGNQGTTILIENLFYNVATRRKALASPSEEFAKIADVVTRYAVHNAGIGFTLKKHGEVIPQVRTPHNSTKMNNIKILYGNPVARELIEADTADDTYKFKVHALVTNPNYSSKRMTLLLFINHRLVDSSPVKKMMEELYSIYLPKKTFPWCYISLEINPSYVDVNVHPTKHEVRFLHEDAIIERIKNVLDEKLSGNNASRTFYLQARLPQVDITKNTLKEVLPEYDKENGEKKIHAREMIRTNCTDQKLDKFNFTIQNVTNEDSYAANRSNDVDRNSTKVAIDNFNDDSEWESAIENASNAAMMACGIKSRCEKETIVDYDEAMNGSQFPGISDEKLVPKRTVIVPLRTPRSPMNANDKDKSNWSSLANETSSAESFGVFSETSVNLVTSTQIEKPSEKNISRSIFDPVSTEEESSNEALREKAPVSGVADRALKTVHQFFATQDNIECAKKHNESVESTSPRDVSEDCAPKKNSVPSTDETASTCDEVGTSRSVEFKSYSVNNFRREVKLRSVLTLRKYVEDNYHEGLREIVSTMIFVGSVDEKSALIQSGLNLYICDTIKLTEELFYEIMLYDFANYGVFKFSEPLPLEELAMLGLETEEAGWSEEHGSKEEIAASVKELLLEKSDMLKEYFSIVIDKRGNLKSLPVLLDKYFPYEAELPLYILRLSTEVDWTSEQPCFDGICRETAKFYSHVNASEGHDWKHVVEHVLYRAMKDSLLPPKHFAHDSTILQIASLPDLYKVFERC